MKIISLNVGLPRLVLRNDEPVSTGIFKEPVAGRVKLKTLNFDGDRQADLVLKQIAYGNAQHRMLPPKYFSRR